MKKVLIFIESLTGGGAEKALVNLVKALNKKKYDITVMTVTDNDIYQEAVMKECKYESFLSMQDYHAGRIRKLLFWISIKYIYNAPAKSVYKKYIHEKYDIEIAFIEGFATKLIAASDNFSSKKIAWVHIDVLNNNYADHFYKSIDHQIDAYMKYDHIICVSDTVKESVKEKYGVTDKVMVIHNLLDYSDIATKAKESIDLKRDSNIQFVAIGRLEHQKGYIRLVKILIDLAKEGYDYSLWIIGEGSQRHELEKLIYGNHVENKIKLLGFKQNPYKYLKEADAFICSSYAEGYNTAVIESCLLNVPVLTVECSGMKELFDNHSFGEIVSNDDLELKNMLKRAIVDPMKLSNYKSELSKYPDKSRLLGNLSEIERVFDEKSYNSYTDI